MAYCAPTDAEIREYVSGYYESQDDCDRFKIKTIGASKEGPLCKEAAVYVEWNPACEAGGPGGVESEVVQWTLWLEDDGQVYGEY
jgi:hypothetical protein